MARSHIGRCSSLDHLQEPVHFLSTALVLTREVCITSRLTAVQHETSMTDDSFSWRAATATVDHYALEGSDGI